MKQCTAPGACLEPYRVLDLSQGGCALCGATLGDMGADVIQIEKPAGDPTRNTGPFYHDIPDPEKSLFWFAYCRSKRGITLDIETADGRELLTRLVKTADFVVESFTPGYLDSLGLGYRSLSALKPSLIMASITPFGQQGPYARYRGADLITWAMSGFMYLHGEPDRAPVWISYPQASLMGGNECSAALMMALWHRQATGEGQHIDVSIQEAVVNILFNATHWWDMAKRDLKRAGDVWHLGAVHVPYGYRCKDGYVSLQLVGGGRVGSIRSSKALVKWMSEDGMAPDWLKGFDWAEGFNTSTLTQETVDRVSGAIEQFLLTRTKQDIMDRAISDDIIVAPENTAKDIWESAQLKARDFWQYVEHPELGDSLPYCGAFLKMSATPAIIRRRAPLIGEHNAEVYSEIGVSTREMLLLKQAGVI